MVAHAHKTRLLVLLEGDGLVLALAGPPEEEGDAEGGEGHHSEGGPVQLKDKNACKYLFSTESENRDKSNIPYSQLFLQTQRLLLINEDYSEDKKRNQQLNKPKNCLHFSVADPDPYVFGPPGFGTGSISMRSGSGSFCYQAKIVRKT
jgi:hypothetical protein